MDKYSKIRDMQIYIILMNMSFKRYDYIVT